jgi:lipoprotein
MKKIIFSVLILFAISCISFSSISVAQGEMNLPAEINSRIFSTQGAQPLDNLERTRYTNQAIMQMDSSQRPLINKDTDNKDNIPVQNSKKKGLFEGFRVIW